MTAGAASPAAGRVSAVPVPARADYLGALRHELRLAEGYGDRDNAERLSRLIARASAGTPASPARETTSRAPAASRRKR